VCALRFFYGKTLGRTEQVPILPYGKKPHRLPCVLSPEEVAQLLAAARPGRERVLLQTAYACGLHLMEVLNLQVPDIDSAHMVVNVRQGKGNKDRLVPLSVRLLTVLRDYWRGYRPARCPHEMSFSTPEVGPPPSPGGSVWPAPLNEHGAQVAALTELLRSIGRKRVNCTNPEYPPWTWPGGTGIR
jgi:integrase